MKKQRSIIRVIQKCAFFGMVFVLVGVFKVEASKTAADLAGIQDVLLGWAKYMGAAVAFWGAIQLGLAHQDDNPSGKEKGLRILIAGLMIAGIGALVVDTQFFKV